MEDRADEQCVACFFPVISLLEAAFRIDQHIGDILNVAHFPFAAPDFEQRIIGGRGAVGGIEEQDAAVLRAKARGELPVLALDVVDDATPRPGEQCRDDEPDTLARSCGREAERSEEHTSELQSLMRTSYAVFCLKKKKARSNEARF